MLRGAIAALVVRMCEYLVVEKKRTFEIYSWKSSLSGTLVTVSSSIISARKCFWQDTENYPILVRIGTQIPQSAAVSDVDCFFFPTEMPGLPLI